MKTTVHWGSQTACTPSPANQHNTVKHVPQHACNSHARSPCWTARPPPTSSAPSRTFPNQTNCKSVLLEDDHAPTHNNRHIHAKTRSYSHEHKDCSTHCVHDGSEIHTWTYEMHARTHEKTSTNAKPTRYNAPHGPDPTQQTQQTKASSFPRLNDTSPVLCLGNQVRGVVAESAIQTSLMSSHTPTFTIEGRLTASHNLYVHIHAHIHTSMHTQTHKYEGMQGANTHTEPTLGARMRGNNSGLAPGKLQPLCIRTSHGHRRGTRGINTKMVTKKHARQK
jgi:hypothetical protein